MGGEVIIIAQDPDLRPGDVPPPIPKVQVSNVRLLFSDYANSDEISSAVKKVLDTASSVRDGG